MAVHRWDATLRSMLLVSPLYWQEIDAIAGGQIAEFRLGIYVFKDATSVDFAAPSGVFSIARRCDHERGACLIAESMRPVQAQAGLTVLPNYSFLD